MLPEPPFEQIVNLHYAALYRFAFTLTRHEEDACDLTQETFWIWAEKGHQLRDKSKAKTWLFTTLHRQFLLRQKKIIRMPTRELDAEEQNLVEDRPLPFEQADRETILQALGQIDQPFQAAVALFYLEEYTHQQMSEILNVPLGTVKSRISRGITQLQQRMNPPGKNSHHRKENCG